LSSTIAGLGGALGDLGVGGVVDRLRRRRHGMIHGAGLDHPDGQDAADHVVEPRLRHPPGGHGLGEGAAKKSCVSSSWPDC
jgi:hypothetical protein